jgi:septin family protein
MSYSFKEKAKLLRELTHSSHAGKDLELLKSIAPFSELLKFPILSPERYAERILSELLDHATAEAIRLNRRGKIETTKSSTDEKTAETKPQTLPQGGGTNPAVGPLEGTANGKDDSQESGQPDDKTNAEPEEVREELENAKEELESAREELEETQDELEKTKELLEEEKKSE